VVKSGHEFQEFYCRAEFLALRFTVNHSSASEKYTPMECTFQKRSFQNS
jgi:hypothetical protein